MIVRYAGASAVGAKKIAACNPDIQLVRNGRGGDINWGRAKANTTLNPDISATTNKRKMRELFREYKVPMPTLALDAEEVCDMLPWMTKFVGRPDKHTRGKGFWLCKTPEDVRRALRGTRKKQAATHFMEYIDADKEVRVHIFLGKSIRISEKQYDDKHDGYVTIKPSSDKAERKRIREAAKQAVEAVGLDFGAVDILVKDGMPYVLEVNAAPGLGGSMPQLYADTFAKWFESK